jgi:hypothetical protein
MIRRVEASRLSPVPVLFPLEGWFSSTNVIRLAWNVARLSPPILKPRDLRPIPSPQFGRGRLTGHSRLTDSRASNLGGVIGLHLNSGTTSSIMQAELEAAAARLDALYEKACKGVHSEVTVDEVRLVLISAYLLIADVVRLTELGPTAQGAGEAKLPSTKDGASQTEQSSDVLLPQHPAGSEPAT